MPVRPGRESFHHFPPIRLHRIQIANRNMEQALAEPIVDAGYERLLVRPLLESCYHVRRPVENRRDESRNILGLILEIGRIKNEHRTAGVQISGAQGFSDSAPVSVARRREEWILALQRA